MSNLKTQLWKMRFEFHHYTCKYKHMKVRMSVTRCARMTSGAYFGRLLHLIADVDLPELLEEAEHGEVELLAAAARQLRVGEVHQLEDAARQLAVHRVVLVGAREAHATAHHRADNVDEPRQPACRKRQ